MHTNVTVSKRLIHTT